MDFVVSLSAKIGVLVVLSRNCGQHLQIFIFGAIRENFVLQKFPTIRYDTFVMKFNVLVCVWLHIYTHIKVYRCMWCVAKSSTIV